MWLYASTGARMSRPLTSEMLTALDHMAAGEDRSLVRAYSHWWVRESDAGAALGPAVTLKGKLLASGAPIADHLNILNHWR